MNKTLPLPYLPPNPPPSWQEKSWSPSYCLVACPCAGRRFNFFLKSSQANVRFPFRWIWYNNVVFWSRNNISLLSCLWYEMKPQTRRILSFSLLKNPKDAFTRHFTSHNWKSPPDWWSAAWRPCPTASWTSPRCPPPAAPPRSGPTPTSWSPSGPPSSLRRRRGGWSRWVSGSVRCGFPQISCLVYYIFPAFLAKGAKIEELISPSKLWNILD